MLSILLCRYKPIILFSTICGSIIYFTLYFSTSRTELLICQILYGSLMAAEVAYYTYIYASVERDKYQIVTGYSRSAILIGRFISSAIAQTLISFRICNYDTLALITGVCKS